MSSQYNFSLWTPLLKAWLCLEAYQSGRQITDESKCRVKEGTRMANRASVPICTPWFKVEAAVLQNEQCLAFGTFLLPSITPIAAIDNYKVQQKSLTGLRHVVRDHHATNQVRLTERASCNIPTPVALANDNAIIKIGRICKPLPEPINPTAANYSSDLANFESGPSYSRYNKTSPRSFPSYSISSTKSECWPNARKVVSSAGPLTTLDSPQQPIESGRGTFMTSRQPSFHDLAQIAPAIIANPVQRKSSLPRIPSPADRQTFEALLEVGIGKSEESRTTHTTKATPMLRGLPTSSSTESKEKVYPGSNAVHEVGHSRSLSPIQASHETENLNHTVTFAMTAGSYEPNKMHAPSVIRDEKFLGALSKAEIVQVGQIPEHMSLFQVLVDGHGSQSRSEALDWLNIDQCHCPSLDTEIERLDLSQPQFRAPRAGNFRADLISCQLPTLEAGMESREATIVEEGESLDTASQNNVDPSAELARMAPGEEVKRVTLTRNDDMCASASGSGPDTNKFEIDQADMEPSLGTSPVSEHEANEDPVDRLLDDARRAGGSSFTIRSALKDAIFRKNIRRSDPKIRIEQSHGAISGDTVKSAKASPHPLSQSMHQPADMVQEGRKTEAGPKQLTRASRRSQNETRFSINEDRSAKEDSITTLRGPKHCHSNIPARTKGNRARFTWIPHDRFNAVEEQVSKSDSGVEAIKSEIVAEDPFTEEGAVYTSHTRCQLALAHAARILEAQLR